MRIFFLCCAALCFIAIFKLPIAYYTILRIVISIGAILAIYCASKDKNYAAVIAFAIILFLFNPIVPFYLLKKSNWLLFDIATGMAFLFFSFYRKIHLSQKKKVPVPLTKATVYTRDRIISPKTKN